MKLNCDDALQLKVGDILYEYGYGHCLESTVTKEAVEENGQVEWETVSSDGHKINYLITREFEHYGPDVYNYPAYSFTNEDE